MNRLFTVIAFLENYLLKKNKGETLASVNKRITRISTAYNLYRRQKQMIKLDVTMLRISTPQPQLANLTQSTSLVGVNKHFINECIHYLAPEFYPNLSHRLKEKLKRYVKAHENSRHFTKTADILRKQPTFCDATTGFHREMTSEKRAQKFHADDVPLPRSGLSLLIG